MQTKESRIEVLAETPPLKAILAMAIPVILGMIVQVLYNMVDTFFVGKLNDVNQLAAANVSFPFFMIMMGFGGIIGVGAASVISRYLGMKKTREAGEIVGLAFILVVAVGIVVTALSLAFLEPILSLIGARGDVVPPTRAYLVPLILGSTAIMGNFTLGVMIRAEGGAVNAMRGMIIGSVVNIILNPIMIFTFGWGIAGSAWATVTANAVGILWYLWCYARASILKISFGRHIWRSAYFREIFSIGIPSGINQGLMSLAVIIANNLATEYGAAVLAAMGIASKVNSLIILMLIGLATGCQPLFGYNYGAGNRARLVSILKTSMALGVGMGAVLFGAFVLTDRWLISAFSAIPEVVDQGSFILIAMACSAPAVGVIMIVMNCLQAIGKAIPSLILSAGRQGVFYIPLLFALNGLFGFHGLVFTQPIVDFLMAIVATLMLRFVVRTDSTLRKGSTPRSESGPMPEAR
jgi:putative MATE family efflux protein